MKRKKVLMAVAIAATVGFVSCKPKDADIKTALEEKIKATAELTGVTVDVKDGVATLTGVVKDSTTLASAKELLKDVKGVKDITNSLTVPAPVVTLPASIATILDAATQQKVKDGLKDIKDVTVEFAADKALLAGAVTKADRMKIMQMLAAAKVKSDVSKLTDKK